MSKQVNDSNIRVEPVFDYKHGRRFQIIVVNKQTNDSFTVHKDMMGRDYMKLKLNEADLMTLLNEVRKVMVSPDSDPKIAEARFKKGRFTVIDGKKDE